MVASTRDARTKYQGMPPLERLVITIPDEPLHPAGTLTSVVEGCLVVQGRPGATPLDVGSALCTADRLPLGLVEDIFGPVNAPLYVLRFAGESGEPPASLQPGVEVFAVPSMMQLVEQAALEGAWQGAGSDQGEDESDDECEGKKDAAPPVVHKPPTLAKRARRGGRGRGGRGQPQTVGGAAFNAESLLAGCQFHWQGPPAPVQPPAAQYAAWQGAPPAWGPAPPSSLPPSYYRPQ